jgi:hypothetical protein
MRAERKITAKLKNPMIQTSETPRILKRAEHQVQPISSKEIITFDLHVCLSELLQFYFSETDSF